MNASVEEILQALGEEVVKNRLLQARIAQLESQLAALQAQLEGKDEPDSA